MGSDVGPRVHEHVLVHHAPAEPQRIVLSFPLRTRTVAPPPPARTPVDALVDLWRHQETGNGARSAREREPEVIAMATPTAQRRRLEPEEPA